MITYRLRDLEITTDDNNRIVEIQEPLIFFSDGSTINIITGELVSSSLGKIYTIKQTLVIARYVAPVGIGSLSLINSVLGTKIQPYSGRRIEVTTQASQEEIDSTKTYLHDGSVVVKSSLRPSALHRLDQRDIQIGSGRVKTIEFEPLYRTTINVPIGTMIHVSFNKAPVDIGDINGPLDLVADTYDINFCSGTSAYLATQGRGHIRGNKVTGYILTLVAAGQNIHIQDGHVHHLTVNLLDEYDVQYLGSADTATIENSPNSIGNITIGSCKQPKITERGCGHITINSQEF